MFKKVLLLLSMMLFVGRVMAAPTTWQPLAEGLSYTKLPLENTGQLHAFQIDLHHYQMDLALAADNSLSAEFVAKLAEKNQAILGINGGFFSPESQPLGLRIQQGKQRNPLKNITWWGIFYIDNNQAHIVAPAQFHAHSTISMAVQSGPRLIVDGTTPSLKGNIAERSALCITPEGQVIIAITEYAAITTTELAKLLMKPLTAGGLNCRDALNLDGGSSSQLYAHIRGFYLNITNFNRVTDAVIVKAR